MEDKLETLLSKCGPARTRQRDSEQRSARGTCSPAQTVVRRQHQQETSSTTKTKTRIKIYFNMGEPL